MHNLNPKKIIRYIYNKNKYEEITYYYRRRKKKNIILT